MGKAFLSVRKLPLSAPRKGSGAESGGTVLQPRVELLEHTSDFPKDAPLLIMTDGECDRLKLYGRNHAFLLPRGRNLPFPPHGPVFYLD